LITILVYSLSLVFFDDRTAWKQMTSQPFSKFLFQDFQHVGDRKRNSLDCISQLFTASLMKNPVVVIISKTHRLYPFNLPDRCSDCDFRVIRQGAEMKRKTNLLGIKTKEKANISIGFGCHPYLEIHPIHSWAARLIQ